MPLLLIGVLRLFVFFSPLSKIKIMIAQSTCSFTFSPWISLHDFFSAVFAVQEHFGGIAQTPYFPLQKKMPRPLLTRYLFCCLCHLRITNSR